MLPAISATNHTLGGPVAASGLYHSNHPTCQNVPPIRPRALCQYPTSILDDVCVFVSRVNARHVPRSPGPSANTVRPHLRHSNPLHTSMTQLRGWCEFQNGVASTTPLRAPGALVDLFAGQDTSTLRLLVSSSKPRQTLHAVLVLHTVESRSRRMRVFFFDSED